MDKLTDWVRANVKDGANLAEFEGMIKDKLLPDMPDKDAAIKFARSHPMLNSALDSSILAAVQSHDSKFQAEKLPQALLRHKTEKDCTVRMWEQGSTVTVAFNNCQKSCDGQAFDYLWPVVVDARSGRCH